MCPPPPLLRCPAQVAESVSALLMRCRRPFWTRPRGAQLGLDPDLTRNNNKNKSATWRNRGGITHVKYFGLLYLHPPARHPLE